MLQTERRIERLGLTLPEPPKPAAAYVPFILTNDLVYISGQGTTLGGKPRYTGRVGKDLTVEQGYEAAKVCALNIISVLKSAVEDLDKIDRIVKVVGFINSAEGFEKQHLVLNGASELLQKAFGERGKHARTAIGVSELPLNNAVVVELIAKVK